MEKPISHEMLKHIPPMPGVYTFFDSNKKLIYVGKAKNLNRRVVSYFIRNDKTPKTLRMVKDIKFFDFSVVNSENEALLLENNIIKQNKPIYNILLKDSKGYPYLILTAEEFPRIVIAEHLDKVEYKCFFGPFSDRHMMYNLLEIIKKTCLLRTCKHNITQEKINNNKYKVCLEYHLNNCCGVCEQHIDSKEYNNNVLLAIEILNGNFKKIKKKVTAQMLQYSKQRAYKLAYACKEKLDTITQYEHRSIISNPDMQDCDVFYCEQYGDKLLVVYMIIKHGMIIFIRKDVL